MGLPDRCKMGAGSRYASEEDCEACGLGEGESCASYKAEADARIAAKRAAATLASIVTDERLEELRSAYAYHVSQQRSISAPKIVGERLESDRQHLSIIQELQAARALHGGK